LVSIDVFFLVRMKEEELSINKNFSYNGKVMRKMFSLIGLMCIFFLFNLYPEEKSFGENQIEELDKQIKLLEVSKKRHLKDIEKHLILARRWQCKGDLSLESRREYALAEHQKDRVRILEGKLEKLKKEKKMKENQEK